jgi:hypothetical protein
LFFSRKSVDRAEKLLILESMKTTTEVKTLRTISTKVRGICPKQMAKVHALLAKFEKQDAFAFAARNGIETSPIPVRVRSTEDVVY